MCPERFKAPRGIFSLAASEIEIDTFVKFCIDLSCSPYCVICDSLMHLGSRFKFFLVIKIF